MGPSTRFKSTISSLISLAGVTWSLVALAAGEITLTRSDGEIFRSFLANLTEASSIESPAARGRFVRLTIAQHPEILQWVAENRDAEHIFREAGLQGLTAPTISNLPIPPREEEKVGDLIIERVKEWMRGKPAIREVLHDEGIDFTSKVMRAPLGDPLLRDVVNGAFVKRPITERMELLEALGNEPYLKVAEEVDQAVIAAKMSETPAIQLLNDSRTGMEIRGVPESMKRMFNDITVKYFDQLPAVDKRRVAAAVLRLPPDSTPDRQLSAALHESGPALQKLFQLFAKDAKSPLLQKVLEELLSSVKSMSPEEVRQTMEKSLGRPWTEVFSHIDDKPLGSGTIGQASLATLKSGEKVVLKIRRTGIREQALREIALLKELVKGTPGQEELIRRAEESLLAELDFRLEAQNTARGIVYQSAKRGLDAVTMPVGLEPKEDLLALQFIEGKPLSKLPDTEVASAGRAISSFLERWVDEAIFQSGFFHADLHSDNFLYVRRPGEDPPFRLTVIDFGSSGTLSLEQRKGFVKLVAAAYTRTPERVLEALRGLVTMTPDQEKALLAAFHKMDFKTENVSDRIGTVLAKALDSGATVPAEILKFNRGRMFLEKQLLEFNSRLEKLDPGRTTPRFSSSATYLKLGSKRAVEQLAKQVVSAEARAKAVVTPGLVLRTAGDKIRNDCRDLFRSLNEKAHGPITGTNTTGGSSSDGDLGLALRLSYARVAIE